MAYEAFTSIEAVDEFFAQDVIVCFECGKRFKVLGKHISRQHGMSVRDYQAKYNIPYSQALSGAATLEKLRELGKSPERMEWMSLVGSTYGQEEARKRLEEGWKPSKARLVHPRKRGKGAKPKRPGPVKIVPVEEYLEKLHEKFEDAPPLPSKDKPVAAAESAPQAEQAPVEPPPPAPKRTDSRSADYRQGYQAGHMAGSSRRQTNKHNRLLTIAALDSMMKIMNLLLDNLNADDDDPQ